MGGVGIRYVNTFLIKVEAFPGGAPLTMCLFLESCPQQEVTPLELSITK